MAVVETGALNGAAPQMEISPSVVTEHIAAQANELGVQSLDRTTRRVALTEISASYLQSCQLIIAELDKADCKARNASGSVRGGYVLAPQLALLTKMWCHIYQVFLQDIRIYR